MTLEWLRRHDPALSAHMKTYLFTEGSVLEIEKSDTGDGEGGGPPGKPSANGGAHGSGRGSEGSLGIGSLRTGAKRDE